MKRTVLYEMDEGIMYALCHMGEDGHGEVWRCRADVDRYQGPALVTAPLDAFADLDEFKIWARAQFLPRYLVA